VGIFSGEFQSRNPWNQVSWVFGIVIYLSSGSMVYGQALRHELIFVEFGTSLSVTKAGDAVLSALGSHLGVQFVQVVNSTIVLIT